MNKYTIYLFFWVVFLNVSAVAQGIITTIAGDGINNNSGDGGPAILAGLNYPKIIAGDSIGNLYVISSTGISIRKIDGVTGIISTIAGNDTAGGFSGDGGLATNAKISNPQGGCTDKFGNIYFADYFNFRIRKIDISTGIITTVAGGDTSAPLANPSGVAVDVSGNIYISQGCSIKKVDAATGIMTTIAGNTYTGYTGDGGSASNALLSFPRDLCVDKAGNLYINDMENNVIREINANTGIITTIAGNGYGAAVHGVDVSSGGGYSGDGGPATNAELFWPSGLYVDGNNNVYFGDMLNNRVRVVNASSGYIYTVAGNGYGASVFSGWVLGEAQITPDSGGFTGDDGLALLAELRYPSGVFVDPSGNIYFADQGNYRIRKVSTPTSAVPISPAHVQYNIFPDPTSGTFTIQTANNQVLQSVDIYNTLGEKVYQGTLSASQIEINLSSQPEGIYTIYLESEEQTTVQKIVIRH